MKWKLLLLSAITFCVQPLMASEQPAKMHSESQALKLNTLGMDISEAEQAAIVSAIQSAWEISAAAHKLNSPRYGNHYRRDAHAKATGCVRAEFEINGDIPGEFRHSIFSNPGRSYQAWIRFSNGDMQVQPDSKGDARGMAVKVMNTGGTPIAPELGESGLANQDFIMTNTPAFFNRNIYDYAENMQHLAKLDRRGWFISAWPPRLHLKELWRAYQTVSSTIDTPLGEQYFSMLPYRLGENPIKYSTRPCAGSDYPSSAEHSEKGENFLTEKMVETLTTGSACFDFLVQPRLADASESDMPLDDGTVIWEESQSPFIPVARIHIPPQEITDETQQTFCENLSMNPWRGVGEWEPLGSLNRARRLVYHAVSEYRHQKNHAPQQEPGDWCLPGSEVPCSETQGLRIRKPRWPLPRCFDGQYRPADGSATSSDCGDYHQARNDTAEASY
ncbi:catalase family protein [uncultured Microbulbifer sp.]|uniref:catalase family protein n=1 Tax=uncultured Microbulbifer sp. TaxID=348147 RepID=UPI00263111DF|nr:catalase family protein [uncultured Microbulbifer sp.]